MYFDFQSFFNIREYIFLFYVETAKKDLKPWKVLDIRSSDSHDQNQILLVEADEFVTLFSSLRITKSALPRADQTLAFSHPASETIAFLDGHRQDHKVT